MGYREGPIDGGGGWGSLGWYQADWQLRLERGFVLSREPARAAVGASKARGWASEGCAAPSSPLGPQDLGVRVLLE